MKLTRILASCLLFAACACMSISAHAARDEVQFGSTIRVSPGESIHDAVCFFCSVQVEGTVDHDIVVFFGNVRINGHANHDIVNFFGSVRAADNTSIGHDLVSMVGSVHLGENVTVGNDVVAIFGSLHAADSASIAGNRVVQPAWLLLIPLTIVGLILVAIVSAVRGYRRRRMFAGYPFPPPPHP